MNWKSARSAARGSPRCHVAHRASTLQPVSTSRESGFRQSRKSLSARVGLGIGRRGCRTRRTSASTAVGGVHPVDRRALDLAAVGGIAAAAVGIVARRAISITLPFSSFTQPVQRDQIRALQAALRAAGDTGAYTWGSASSMKSSASIQQLAGEGDLVRAGVGVGRGCSRPSNGLALALRDSS